MADYRNTGLDWASRVAIGQVAGWTPFRKFAMNNDMDSGTEQIWPLGTIQVLPTTAAVASTVSSSTDDDLAGTGARNITIYGLDANYALVEETIDMDGTTAVTTTQTFLRIYSANVTVVGTGAQNAGNITISVGGNAQAYIEAGEGQSHISQYTVPANYTLLLNSLDATVGRISGTNDLALQWQMRLYNESSNNNYESWRSILDTFPYQTQILVTNATQLVPEKADIRVLGVTGGTNLVCQVDYSGYLIETDYID